MTPELWFRVVTKLLIAAGYVLEALNELLRPNSHGWF